MICNIITDPTETVSLWEKQKQACSLLEHKLCLMVSNCYGNISFSSQRTDELILHRGICCPSVHSRVARITAPPAVFSSANAILMQTYVHIHILPYTNGKIIRGLYH